MHHMYKYDILLSDNFSYLVLVLHFYRRTLGPLKSFWGEVSQKLDFNLKFLSLISELQ